MNDRPQIACVAQLALVTAQPDVLAAFFVTALDAEIVGQGTEDGSFADLVGVPGAVITCTTLRVGAQEVVLLAFDPPGRPYPVGSTSSDLWFQHFAFIVSDMDEAYARLMRVGAFMPISRDGPQLLPPDAGAVTAFKFRDLEGHPLELLAFPSQGGPDVWRQRRGQALVLGIDHSAIAVSDAQRSVAFFERAFGLTLGPRSLNQGPAQSRMDDVPDARVSVNALLPANAPPHVELLGYEVGTRRPIDPATAANDLAATFFVLETDDLAQVAAAAEAEGARFVSPGIVTLSDGRDAFLILDPDGHRFLVRQRAI